MALLFFAPLIVAVVIYWDAKNLRRRGVPVNPGFASFLAFLFSILILFLPMIIHSIIPRLPRFLYSPTYNYFFPLIPGIAYLVLRVTKFGVMARAGNPPLPPAPHSHRWMALLIFLLVGAFVILPVLFFISLFGPCIFRGGC